MKILLVQRFDLASVSCARRVICQTQELLHRGHEVTITDFVHEQRRSEIPALTQLSTLGATILPLERKITRFFKNIQRIQRLQPPPEIIHLWKSYPDASLPAIYFSRKWNVPLHYDWDDWERGITAELTGSKAAGDIAGRWDRRLPFLSDTMTVASEFLRATALRWGFPADRIWDAPVGADIQTFFPQNQDSELQQRLGLEKPILVYVGQLEVASYAEQTVEALAEISREFATATLLILGGGKKLERIRQYAERFHLNSKIVCTDYISGDAVPRYLALADVALAPFEENDVTRAKSPLKIAEYLAMGIPVVASDVGEAKKMTMGAGVCVRCGDVEDLARKVVWILRNPDIRRTMSVNGRKRAETHYNWKNHVDNLLAAYQFALTNLRRTAPSGQ